MPIIEIGENCWWWQYLVKSKGLILTRDENKGNLQLVNDHFSSTRQYPLIFENMLLNTGHKRASGKIYNIYTYIYIIEVSYYICVYVDMLIYNFRERRISWMCWKPFQHSQVLYSVWSKNAFLLASMEETHFVAFCCLPDDIFIPWIYFKKQWTH